MSTKRSSGGKPKPSPPRDTNWYDMASLCKKMHHYLYREGDVTRARRYLHSLKRTLDLAPKSRIVIVRQEALALLYELEGHLVRAIAYRERELELKKRLYKSFDECVRAGKYDKDRAEELRIYTSCDRPHLLERQAMLKTLKAAVRKAGKSQKRSK